MSEADSLRSTQVTCPTCGGSGQVAPKEFNVGDRVVWNTKDWWGKKHAVVISLAKTRVRIKTDPHTNHNSGKPWICYVSPANLEKANG